ncbi:MAG: exonuclease SbcCD subunit D, partial [Alphaproteobacteria bacterium]
PFPIVMIPGNHDCMEAGAIYRRYDFNRIDNVTMLNAEAGELTLLSELDVAVWGKGMVEHTPQYSPLAGCPERPADCRWFLGMGHGLFVPHRGDTGRSSPIHMREIEANACDYLALGHHHAAMELMTDQSSAAYSGSPTDTVGRGPTYATVDLAEGRPARLEIHTVKAFG